jgi:mannose-6-phosphate isomerase-like protein (cupin superfamily)
MAESLGDAPDRAVELICEHDDVHATLSRYGPGRAGADLHVHHEHTDIFHVLEGELTVMLADEEVVLGPGELVHVPPHVVHGFRNGSGADVRFLNFHIPPCGFADYMRGLRDGVKVPFDQHPAS